MPYLSASAVVIHYEEELYQVYAPLPFRFNGQASSPYSISTYSICQDFFSAPACIVRCVRCVGVGRLAVCPWRLGSASGAYQYPSAGSGELRARGVSLRRTIFRAMALGCRPVPVVGGDGPWPRE